MNAYKLKKRVPIPSPIIRHLGLQTYEPVWRHMQAFTNARNAETQDEIWFLEHTPVFTLGLNGKTEHLLAPGEIPVVPVDRGGQVTYHAPGQLIAYTLVDLRRLGLSVRPMVSLLEQSVIDLLSEYSIVAQARREAPGVYVDGKKIAALGLKVRRGCCFHGLAFNVAMDLGPFARIYPCGYRGLEVTQLADLGGPDGVATVAGGLESHLLRNLGYTRNP